jgi:glycosyltransferase involved in cell wall biosynthesis
VRIAVVGAAHPYKGGIAAHTTDTARHLAAAGHDVVVVSWSRLYPHRLYPGEQAIPGGGHDVPPFEPTVRPLRWDRPGTWWRTGRRLRAQDVLVVQAVVPLQVPALLALIRAARGPRIVVIAHNVVPHEAHPGAGRLMELLLRRADLVVTHSAEQARLAREHGARAAVAVDLPPHLPGGMPDAGRRASIRSRREADRPIGVDGVPAGPVRVLSFGIVREYKGVDLLLQALREVDGVSVTVAGELWGAAGEQVRQLSAAPELAGRVRLLAGYVSAADVPELFAGHDVLALTYRHATATQNVAFAHAYGLPVLASTAGSLADQVRDGVDGLVVPAGDVGALAAALRRLRAPGMLAGLRSKVPQPDPEAAWDRYLGALLQAPGDAPGTDRISGRTG